MEIEYRRDVKQSFMCVSLEEKLTEFEKELLERNKINSLLPMRYSNENGKNIYWYDITGKQALDNVLETTPIQSELLVQLFASLCSMLETVEKYLLGQENILLCTEGVFRNNEDGSFKFCYCPGKKDSMQEEFRHLIENIMTKIDHKDEVAVKLIYDIYDQSLKPGYSILSIRQQINYEELKSEHFTFQQLKKSDDMRNIGEQDVQAQKEDVAKSKKVKNKSEEANNFRELDGRKEEKRKKDVRKEDRRRGNQGKENQGIEFKNKEDNFWKQKMKEFIRGIVDTYFPDMKKIKEYIISKQRDSKQSELQKIEPIVFEPEEEISAISRPTVLLAEKKTEQLGILRYEGENSFPDLKLNSMPYLIGSSEECDGYLEKDTISRKHARITVVDDVYLIEDLNSANGTMVGGECLPYKMKMSIEKNEIIVFADEKFRFI